MMKSSAGDTGNNMKSRFHRFSSTNPDLLSIPDEEDEAHLHETIGGKVPPLVSLIPIQPWSNLLRTTPTAIPPKRYSSRLYKFVQLEKALKLANLFKDNHDRTKFEQEYRQSLRENEFDEFLQIYYRKLQVHRETIKRERAIRTSRTFTFVDLEKNFLALDPARDIKIVYLNNSTTTDMTNTHLTNPMHRYSTLPTPSNDAAIEAFYEKRCRHLLENPSRARDEITLFAREAGKRLHEHLPRLSHMPYRVKIIDERDKERMMDERTLLQMKHGHNLLVIAKRRQLVMKMVTQTRKHQDQIEQLERRTPSAMDNSTYCRELLERVKQIEQTIKEEQIKHPPTDFIPRITTKDVLSRSTTITPSATPSFSSCSTPFQDALSIRHIEQTKNIRVIPPTRSVTAPSKKLDWVNYC